IDMELLRGTAARSKTIVTMEDGISTGGLGSAVAEALAGSGVRVYRVGVPDTPIAQSNIERQDRLCGMDAESVAALVRRCMDESR
ncbi:MAG: transketolase C-terminal domain-containing protein, partial [Clostridia bacterium]|nr:transketolase C-terminal domain-containing protein [Clostridia bacterium]